MGEFTNLPSDTIFVISSFSDFATRIHLRHVNQQLFHFSKPPTNCYNSHRLQHSSFFNIAVDEEDRDSCMVMVPDKPQLYIQFFKELSEQQTVKKDDHSFHRCMLPAILNGSELILERYGVSKFKFIVDLFFDTLFTHAISSSSSSSTTTLEFLFDELARRTPLWNTIEDTVQQLYPRRILFDSIVKLSLEQGERATEIVRKLLFDCQLGIDFITFHYTRNRDLLDDSPYVHLIPKTSCGFSLIHLATWLKDYKLIQLLLVKRCTTVSCSVDALDKLHRTPLSYCIVNEELNQMGEWLLKECGANPFQTDYAGWNAYHLAQLYKRDQLIQLINELHAGDEELLKELPARFDHGEPTQLNDDLEREDINLLESYYNSGMSRLYEPDDSELKSGFHYYMRTSSERNYDYDSSDEECLNRWDESCWEDKEECGEMREEQGINSDFIQQNRLDVLDGYVKSFEDTFDHYHDAWSEEYDSESDMKSIGVHVKSRKPFNNTTTNSNEYGKRIRSDADDNDEKMILNSNKRVKREENCDPIVNRSSLFIPKHVFRLMVQEEVLTYSEEVNRFTPLSIFILQQALEKWLEKNFEIANHFAQFYCRETLWSMDMYLANRYLFGRPFALDSRQLISTLKDGVVKQLEDMEDMEEDDYEEEEGDTDSDISSDSCSSFTAVEHRLGSSEHRLVYYNSDDEGTDLCKYGFNVDDYKI